MDYLEFLFAGFAVFWAGLLIYLLWLQARLREVREEVRRLDERLAEGDHRDPAVATRNRPAHEDEPERASR